MPQEAPTFELSAEALRRRLAKASRLLDLRRLPAAARALESLGSEAYDLAERIREDRGYVLAEREDRS